MESNTLSEEELKALIIQQNRVLEVKFAEYNNAKGRLEMLQRLYNYVTHAGDEEPVPEAESVENLVSDDGSLKTGNSL